MSAFPQASRGPLPAGHRIGGKYVIRRLVARGGSSEVYEAEHAAIGRQVAIKVVHTAIGVEDGILERLRREARICGSLRHPHVCQIYDVGHLEEGTAFLVMELLEGPTLADMLDEGPLPLPTVVEVGRAVASALASAHREGVVHRDIKPHNIILHHLVDGSVLVKLVDFGIARPLVFTDADRSVTVEGMLVGTPHYMSPEQLRADPPDARSDVYSLGVVLYEALTGRVPFDEPTLATLSAAVLRDPIIPVRRLRPDCGRDLEALVLQAIDRDPRRRIQTAAELANRLQLVADERQWPTGTAAFRVPRAPAPSAPADDSKVTTLPGLSPEDASVRSVRDPHVRSVSSVDRLERALTPSRLGPVVSTTAEHPLPPTFEPTPSGGVPAVSAADSLAPPAPRTLPPPAEPRRSRATWAVAAAALLSLGAGGWWWWTESSTPAEVAASPERPTEVESGGDPVAAGAAAATLTAEPSARASSMASGDETPSVVQPGASPEAAPGVAEDDGDARRRRAARAARRSRRAAERRADAARSDEPPSDGADESVGAAAAQAPEDGTEQAAAAHAAEERAVALSGQALAAYARGQLPRARALYRRATQADPQHAPAWRGLGLASARMGQDGEARRALRRYLELEPGARDAARVRGMLEDLSGD